MFRNSYRLFSIAGFEVKAHFSWVIVVFLVSWILATGFFPFRYPELTAAGYWLMGLAGALGLFLSILIHELSHSLVARRHGVPMRGITLFIFGGVAEMEEEPPNAKSELQIALAGPATTIVLAFLFYGLHEIGIAAAWPVFVIGTLFYLTVINGLLAVFNLIPAFPLDGGRALRALFWYRRRNLRSATRTAAGIGVGFSFLLMFMGLLSVLGGAPIAGLWWILIGMFLYGMASGARQQVEIRTALAGEPIHRFMNRNPVTVSPQTSLRSLVEDYVYRYHHKMFPVVEEDGRLTGCISTKEVKEVSRDEWDHRQVQDVLQRCSAANTLSPTADAMRVLSEMNRSGNSRMMIREGDRLAGVVSLKDMMAFLALKLDLEGEQDVEETELGKAA